MNPRISHLISHPFESGADDVPALQDEIDKYPYFSTLRLLMLFGLKEHEHPSFQEELKLAAIQSPSRTALYHYLQKERQIQEVTEEETAEVSDAIESRPEIKSTEEKEERQMEEEAPTATEEVLTSEEVSVQSSEPETDTKAPEEAELTFSQWLSFAGKSKETEKAPPTEKEIKYRLIDEFIEKAPKISPVGKEAVPDPAVPRADFAPEYSDLMTETLAQIYLEQKKYDKAIRAYKILGLKYPDKSEIFHDKIREVENMRDGR